MNYYTKNRYAHYKMCIQDSADRLIYRLSAVIMVEKMLLNREVELWSYDRKKEKHTIDRKRNGMEALFMGREEAPTKRHITNYLYGGYVGSQALKTTFLGARLTVPLKYVLERLIVVHPRLVKKWGKRS